MKTAQLPLLLIFSIELAWSQHEHHSSGQQGQHQNGSFIDLCHLEKLCGDNGKCYSTFGRAFKCICIDGITWTNKSKPCIEIDCPSEENDLSFDDHKSYAKFEEGDGEAFYSIILEWASGINDQCHSYKRNNSNNSEPSLMAVTNTVNGMIHNTLAWNNMQKSDRQEGVMLLLNCMDSVIMMTSASLGAPKYNLTTPHIDVQIQVLQEKEGTVVLLAKDNEMDIHWETDNSEPSDFAAVSLVTYNQMESLMDGTGLEMENKKYGKEYLQLNSNVLTAKVISSNKTQQNANFTIKNKQVDDVDDYTVCVYLDVKNKMWSTSGCTKVSSNHTHTVCNSKHLSSFAVLVALYKVEGPGLTAITYIGIITSLVSLFIAIVTFIMCRAIHSTRTALHTQLCLCLFVAELLFLIGLSATGNKAVCAAIAGILHYLFLACFMWMLLEGIQLYLMVVKVFLSQSLQAKYTHPVAYGIPAIIVIISAASNPSGYGTREYCWLSMDKGFRWSFVGPLCVICSVNFFFLVLTLWKLVQKFYTISPDLSYLQRVRMFIITAFAKLVLLGGTWILGVFHYQKRTIALAYIFTILNSFQGLFIFLLHCVKHKQIRDQYHRWFTRFSVAMNISKYTTFADSTQRTCSSQANAKQSVSGL
ncbi:adhesion G protein-coupled receptor E3-like [Carcharodon carcharias]|uniref:adhesion G protein-coupled receptor E3-like n=1 Tax=Carcharodon carcharias TaxID=13397 RepID=UPI001B7ECF8F|nr:adhesion G protein-coupled receptor E3-like [Carcharodon carcharias]